MNKVTTDKFIEVLLLHTKSAGRYKAIMAIGQNLPEFIWVSKKLKGVEPELYLFDGLKQLTSTDKNWQENPIEAKYWFQQKLNQAPLTIVYRLDWLLAKWNDTQRVQWLDFLARLEVRSTLLFFSTWTNTSTKWEELSELVEVPGISIWKPKDSKFEISPKTPENKTF